METIVVIGEKSERSLKDTTSSISVISEDVLNSLQNYTVNNIVAEVPNVVVHSGHTATIRGAFGNGPAGGFNSITGGAKARVSTIIDGVAEPFVADLSGDSGIWDIEQIEVYRGPQSTSNGRNSIGGMIYLKTKDPSFEWESSARLGYRNEDRYVDGSMMVSGPLIEDTLAVRVTAQYLNAETPDYGGDYGATNPADYDLNERKTKRFKAKALWKPSDDLSAMLTYSANDEQGNAGRVYYTGDDPFAYKQVTPRDISTNSDTISLKLNYRINDNVALEALVAYMDYQWGHDTYEFFNDDWEQHLEFDETSYTADIKLNFGQRGDTLTGFLGLAYFEREQAFASSTGRFLYVGDDDSESNALYGEVTYNLNDSWRLIAGLRVEKEQQDRFFDFTTVSNASNLDTDKTLILPKLALQYDVTENTTIGISAREGYSSPGGAYGFLSGEYYFFNEEEVSSYEASLRSSFLDGNVNVSANLFYNDYDGYQAANDLRNIVNVDKVVTQGLELEVRAMLTPALELNAGLGLLESEIENGGADYASAEGNELSMAPGVTGNIGLNYSFNSAWVFGISARYVDEYFSDIDNTKETIAGDYTLVRLQANYATNNWVVNAYVNNAFDEKATTVEALPNPRAWPEGYASIIDRTTLGLTLTYNFM